MSDNFTFVVIVLICAILFYKFVCLTMRVVRDVHPELARSKPAPVPAPEPPPAPTPDPAAPMSEEMQHALCFFTEMAVVVKTGKVNVSFIGAEDGCFFRVWLTRNDARTYMQFPLRSDFALVSVRDYDSALLHYSEDNVPPEVWAAAVELRNAVHACVAEELAAHQARIAAMAAVPPPKLSSFAMFKQTNCGCARSQETK